MHAALAAGSVPSEMKYTFSADMQLPTFLKKQWDRQLYNVFDFTQRNGAELLVNIADLQRKQSNAL